jgi:hypothetical protein
MVWLRTLGHTVYWNPPDWSPTPATLTGDQAQFFQAFVRADAFQDLTTSENKLSFFFLPDDQQLIERVVAAVFCGRQSYGGVGYSLLNDSDFKNVNLKMEKSKGNSPDAGINQYHYDAIKMTTDDLNRLAKAILGSRIFPQTDSQIKILVQRSIGSRFVKRENINDKKRDQYTYP